MYRIEKKRLIPILFGIMLICFGLGTLILYVSNGFSFNFEKYSISVSSEKTSDINGIEEIIVTSSVHDLTIIPEDREDIRTTISGSILSSSEVDQPEITMDKNSGKLKIGIKEQNIYFGFTSINLKVTVYLPKSYSKDLSLNTNTGDINITDKLTLNNFSCSLDTGDTILKNISCNNFKYDSDTGNLTIDELNCSKLQYENDTGTLDANTINAKESTLSADTGRIKIKNFKGDLKGDTTTGDISIAYTEFSNNVNLRSNTGDIDLRLPNTSEFYLDARSDTGSVECSFPITISGKNKDHLLTGTVKSDKAKVQLTTDTGDINISN